MDDRFYLKVDFKIFGKQFHHECSLNWSPREDDGIDHRIHAMFRDWYEEAKADYDLKRWEAEFEERAKRELEADQKEYERLKAKFEPPNKQHEVRDE